MRGNHHTAEEHWDRRRRHCLGLELRKCFPRQSLSKVSSIFTWFVLIARKSRTTVSSIFAWPYSRSVALASFHELGLPRCLQALALVLLLVQWPQ
ncbi:MAG: hypothetical protein ACKPKO_52000, partial [Candidatus Fonsibacter sp.]